MFVDVSTKLKHTIDALAAYGQTYMSEVRPHPHPRSYEAVRIHTQRHGITVGMLAGEPLMLVHQLI
jgi:hypothetical protein